MCRNDEFLETLHAGQTTGRTNFSMEDKNTYADVEGRPIASVNGDRKGLSLSIKLLYCLSLSSFGTSGNNSFPVDVMSV